MLRYCLRVPQTAAPTGRLSALQGRAAEQKQTYRRLPEKFRRFLLALKNEESKKTIGVTVRFTAMQHENTKIGGTNEIYKILHSYVY